MKEIPVKKPNGGYTTALVDDSDVSKVNTYMWYLASGYAQCHIDTNGKRSSLKMHRLIMDAELGSNIDHVNRNRLDNRRCNLRFCTRSENSYNQGPKLNSASHYKGVKHIKKNNKWVANITVDKKRIYIGAFSTQEEAARIYDAYALRYHGEFASLNFPNEDTLDVDINNIVADRKKRRGHTSSYIGVCAFADRPGWAAQLFHKKRILIGVFDTEEEAAKAYDSKVSELNLVRKKNFD